MKRIGNLWAELTSFRNLLKAAKGAAAGKKKRHDVASFLMNLEPELLSLQRELISGEYQTGAYRTFLVKDPKPRRISAAPFRDRVVHHALTNILSQFSRNGFRRIPLPAAKDSACTRRWTGRGKGFGNMHSN